MIRFGLARPQFRSATGEPTRRRWSFSWVTGKDLLLAALAQRAARKSGNERGHAAVAPPASGRDAPPRWLRPWARGLSPLLVPGIATVAVLWHVYSLVDRQPTRKLGAATYHLGAVVRHHLMRRGESSVRLRKAVGFGDPRRGPLSPCAIPLNHARGSLPERHVGLAGAIDEQGVAPQPRLGRGIHRPFSAYNWVHRWPWQSAVPPRLRHVPSRPNGYILGPPIGGAGASRHLRLHPFGTLGEIGRRHLSKLAACRGLRLLGVAFSLGPGDRGGARRRQTTIAGGIRAWQIGGVGGANISTGSLMSCRFCSSVFVLSLLSGAQAQTPWPWATNWQRDWVKTFALARAAAALGAILLCGATTAICGPIGFVGLVVPSCLPPARGRRSPLAAAVFPHWADQSLCWRAMLSDASPRARRKSMWGIVTPRWSARPSSSG